MGVLKTTGLGSGAYRSRDGVVTWGGFMNLMRRGQSVEPVFRQGRLSRGTSVLHCSARVNSRMEKHHTTQRLFFQ